MEKLTKIVKNLRKSLKICQDRFGRGQGVKKDPRKLKIQLKKQKSQKHKDLELQKVKLIS